MQTPPKNLSVVPSLDISKNSSTRLLSLCTWKEELDYHLHVPSQNIKHSNLLKYTT